MVGGIRFASDKTSTSLNASVEAVDSPALAFASQNSSKISSRKISFPSHNSSPPSTSRAPTFEGDGLKDTDFSLYIKSAKISEALGSEGGLANPFRCCASSKYRSAAVEGWAQMLNIDGKEICLSIL